MNPILKNLNSSPLNLGNTSDSGIHLIMSKNLGNIIRKQRELLGYSQEYMAEELKMTQGAYGKMERGLTNLSVERLYEIAKVLSVSPHDLLDGNISTQKSQKSENIIPNGTEMQSIIDYYKKQIAILEENIKDKNYIIDLLKKQAEK